MNEKLKRYTKYLLSDHWADLRRWKLDMDGKCCFNCGSKSILHVHHIFYRNLTDCTPDDLMVLCESCHNDVHLIAKRTKNPIESITEENVKRLLAEFRKTPYAIQRQAKIEARRKKDRQVAIDQCRAALGYRKRQKCRLWVEVKKFLRRTQKDVRVPGIDREFANELKQILHNFGYEY